MHNSKISSLKGFEDYLIRKHGIHLKILPELLMMGSSQKRAIQYPLIELDDSSLGSLREYCFRKNLTLKIIFDPLSKEKNVLIFRNGDSDVEKLMMSGDDSQRGILFGYPDCCIKNLTLLENSKNLFSNKNILARRGDGEIVINYLNNYFLDNSIFRLFSHLPCSDDCKNTQAISKKTLGLIKNSIPNLHKTYVEMNKLNIALDSQSEKRFLFKGDLFDSKQSPHIIFDVNFFDGKSFEDVNLNDTRIVKVSKK